MKCPYCNTENREDRERCYACDRDLSMLRLIVNKARHHFNQGLEHAERGRLNEAIEEIQNAIDLDRRFAQAHVVLGTIYAKQNQFEKAREAWATALAIEPDLQKAHNYLQKSEQVEMAIPTIRNLQIVSGLLLLLAVILTMLLVGLRRTEDDAVGLLANAQAAYDSGKYATALAELNRIAAMDARNEAVPVAARAMATSIKSELSQQVKLIQELKHREEYAEALAALADLDALEPDDATSGAAAAIRSDINHYFGRQVENLFREFAEGRADYQTLTGRISEFIELYPELPDKDDLRAYLDEARSMEVERRVAETRKAFRETTDAEKALSDIRALSMDFPGLQAVSDGRALLVNDILTAEFDAFREALDSADFKEAGAVLAHIEQIAGDFADIVDVSGPIRLSRQLLDDGMLRKRLQRAEALARNGDPTEAEDAIVSLLMEEHLTTGELELVDLLVNTLDNRELSRQARAVLDEYSRFMELKMTTGSAVALLDSLDRILARDRGLQARDKQRLTACAAAAAVKLSRRDEAERLIARLEENNGDRRTVSSLRRLLATARQ